MAYIWLCLCSGVGVDCFVVNIFVSTFHCQGYLSSLVEIQFFSIQLTSANTVIRDTYNQQVP